MNDEVPSAVKRVDPSAIDVTLKEAVAHALLGSVFQRLSGNGQIGLVLKGEKPSRRLTSAFLMPANPDEEGLDDETSPIRITATGFDFMVRTGAEGIVSVRPQFSIYLRVLPSVEELSEEGVGFRLTQEIDRNVRSEVRARERDLWDQQKDELGGDRNHPDWVQQRANIARDVYEQFNVYENSEIIAVEETNEQVEVGDDVFEVRGFRVQPSDTT